jgi:hypothetical protein
MNPAEIARTIKTPKAILDLHKRHLVKLDF